MVDEDAEDYDGVALVVGFGVLAGLCQDIEVVAVEVLVENVFVWRELNVALVLPFLVLGYVVYKDLDQLKERADVLDQ